MMAANKPFPVLNTCELCGQENLTDEEMKLHMRHEHEDDTACPLCGELGLAGDELWRHITIFHPDDSDIGNTVQSGDTGASTSDSSSTPNNSHRVDGGSSKRNHEVSSMEAAESSESASQRLNTGSHSYDCCLCSQQFSSPSTLSEHLNTVHNDILSPPRKREHQSQSQRQDSNMRPTLSTYRDNSLSCPMCSTTFKEGQLDALTQHVNKHFGNKYMNLYSFLEKVLLQ
jgi:RNA polymerase subunit RPABC4/transcription elongation factor Spt4